MASGYITTSTTNSGQPNNLRLDWSSSGNTSTNTTTITWTLTQAYNGSITASSYYRRTTTPIVRIKNSNNANWDYEYTNSSYNVLYCYTGTQIATGTTTIANNSDGTLNLTFYAQAKQWVSDAYVTSSGTGTGAADTIPRASTISTSSVTIASTSGNLSYTVTSAADFYHRVTYKLGSVTTETNLISGQRINATTYTGTIPYSTLLTAMSAVATSTLYLYCYTYSDAGMTTLIGSKSTSTTIAVNTSALKPTATLGNISVRSGGVNGYLIAGYSVAQATFSSSSSNYASISTNSFAATNGTMATQSSSSASGTAYTTTLPTGSSNYTLTITQTTTDGRGATATASKTATVYGYAKPVLTFNAYRVASNSSTTQDDAGRYVYVTASATYSATGSPVNNTGSVTVTYSISGGASTTLNTVPGWIDLGTNYESEAATITATATDSVTYTSSSKSISTAAFALDLYESSNTYGAGIGTIATANLFKVAIPAQFTNGITGTLTGNATSATNATNATNAGITTTNPSSSTTYYIPFINGANGNRALRANDGVRYVLLEGTSSALGYGALVLGNGTNSGTAGNKYGEVRLYPQTGNYYGRLIAASSLSANRTYTFPNATGTVALTSNIPSTASSTLSPTKTSGNSTLVAYKYVYGRVVTIYFTATFTGTTAAGGDVWVGNLNITELPPYNVTGATYNGSRVLSYALTSAGVLTIRTNSQVTTSQNFASASLTYVY